MARLWTSGYEVQAFGSSLTPPNSPDADSSGTAAPTFDTSIFRSGAASLKCASGAGNGTSYNNIRTGVTVAAGATAYARVYLYIPTSGDLPSSAISIIILDNVVNHLVVKLTSSGTLQLFGTAQVGSDSAALAIARWYCIEVAQTVNAGANDDYLELRLNGVTVASTTTESIGTIGVSVNTLIGWTAAPGANKTIYFDDVAINDSTGAAENSWAGEGKVVLLKPISDNARDTLWTGGVGGTTNLFDAVNNIPPTGTATETDATQIEHAGGAAGTTDRYDANMTSYTTAGIVPGDTINCIQTYVIHGEDSATGAKLLNDEVLSNPAIASAGDYTAGLDVGALGTYPSNWRMHVGNVSYNPSIAPNTSPVMRVRRPETATRVASVCFMGMYVDYTPNLTPPLQIKRRHWVSGMRNR